MSHVLRGDSWTAGALLGALNEVRRAHGLPRFVPDGELDLLAQDWAAWMDRNGGNERSFFEALIHYAYPNRRVVVNVARDFGDADSVVRGWLDDPSYKANLLGDYALAGCGRGGHYWCNLLADYGGAS
jgi:uncharacterized protein YkwD